MKVIPLKYGTMFKQAFSQPDVFCQFVEDILDIKFNATQIHTEYDKTIEVYPHRLVFLCPRQVNDKTPKKIRDWLRFIEDSLDGEMDKNTYPNKLWQKIMEAIRKQDIDPELLSEIKDEAAWEKAKKLILYNWSSKRSFVNGTPINLKTYD